MHCLCSHSADAPTAMHQHCNSSCVMQSCTAKASCCRLAQLHRLMHGTLPHLSRPKLPAKRRASIRRHIRITTVYVAQKQVWFAECMLATAQNDRGDYLTEESHATLILVPPCHSVCKSDSHVADVSIRLLCLPCAGDNMLMQTYQISQVWCR